jgi:replicative DNA helicase
VPSGDPPRSTKRSPVRVTIGSSTTMRAGRDSPGASAPSSGTTRALTSLVPRCSRNRLRGPTARCVVEQRDVGANDGRRPPGIAAHEHRSTVHARQVDAGQRHRGALARRHALHAMTVRLERTDADDVAGGIQAQHFVARERSGPDGAVATVPVRVS